jgi:hypothetical protein
MEPDILLAMLLITSPVGTPAPPPSEDVLARVSSALRVQEILGPDEVYFFAYPDEFQDDIDGMRRRWNLVKDAPPLADWHRFPPRPVIQRLMQFNRTLRRSLMDQIDVLPLPDRDQWNKLVARLREDYDILNELDDAVNEHLSVFYRRLALLKAREKMGLENYLQGLLP